MPASRAPLVWLAKGFVAAPDQPGGVALAHQLLGAALALARRRRVGTELCRRGRARPADRAGRGGHRRGRSPRDVAALLRGDTLRVYESDDIAGVEVGGAIKNVLAIAAGASDGLGFGHNARAALITRGSRRNRPPVRLRWAARARRSWVSPAWATSC